MFLSSKQDTVRTNSTCILLRSAGYIPTYAESIWQQLVISIDMPRAVWTQTGVCSTLQSMMSVTDRNGVHLPKNEPDCFFRGLQAILALYNTGH